MKRKIGSLIEEEVIKLLKHRAADEGRPLSDLIQDALVSYLSKGVPRPKKRGGGLSNVLRATSEALKGAVSANSGRGPMRGMNLR